MRIDSFMKVVPFAHINAVSLFMVEVFEDFAKARREHAQSRRVLIRVPGKRCCCGGANAATGRRLADSGVCYSCQFAPYRSSLTEGSFPTKLRSRR